MASGARLFTSADTMIGSLPAALDNFQGTTTIAGWFNNSSTDTNRCVFGFGTTGLTARGIVLSTCGTTGGTTWGCLRENAGENTTASTLTANTWYHLAITNDVNGNANIRYQNGSQVGGVSTAGYNSATIASGDKVFANNGTAMNFAISDVAIWTTILTPGEILGLSQGVKPFRIQPGFLVAWLPVWGLTSPEPDLSKLANNGVLTGSTVVAGPPSMLFTPRWPLLPAEPPAPTPIILIGGGYDWIIRETESIAV